MERAFSCSAISSFANANCCSRAAKSSFAYSAAPAALAVSTDFCAASNCSVGGCAQPVTTTIAMPVNPTAIILCRVLGFITMPSSPSRMASVHQDHCMGNAVDERCDDDERYQ